MANNKIEIKDSGLNEVGGSIVYTQINSGGWIELPSTRLNSEFTTKTTNNDSSIDDGTFFTFNSNEITAIISPRFTINCLIQASNSTLISNLIQIQRSPSIKQLTGGSGLISGLPDKIVDGSRDFVYVLIKNMTFSEVVAEGVNYIKCTIQLEQVN